MRGGVFQMYENLLQVLLYILVVYIVCIICKKKIKDGMAYKNFIKNL